jgi:PAS domain S-box-containing protein
MVTPLHVLILEDDANDAELLVIELRRTGFEPRWSRVEDEAGFLGGLAAIPDIVLADYSLPQLNALDALRLMRDAGYDTPVIIITGAMSEEACVKSLRHGASDYLLKDRLARLGPSIRHALNEQRLITARRAAEHLANEAATTLQAVVDGAPSMVYLTDRTGRFVLVNAEFERVFQVKRADVIGKTARELPPNALSESMAERDARCRARGGGMEAEEAASWDSEHRTYLSNRYPLQTTQGDTYAVAAIYTEITRQKRTEAELRVARETTQHQADELARANHELTELDRLKSQFLSTVSHELRTPLTSIRGYAEMLVEGDSGQLTAAERRMIGIIDRNGERLLALIENLLDFSRIESGTIPLNLTKVAFAELVEGACAAVLSAVPDGTGLTIVTEIDPDTPIVNADHDLIERVLLNVLSNAVKFSPDGGTISIQVSHDDQDVIISVADCGIGIPADEQERVFERFFRTSSAHKRAIKGTGLGLAISRAIVEAHGGQIDFESVPDAGTTFTIKLPGRN